MPRNRRGPGSRRSRTVAKICGDRKKSCPRMTRIEPNKRMAPTRSAQASTNLVALFQGDDAFFQ